VGAIYLTIVNGSGAAERLVAVETRAAAAAVLHATVEEEGSVRMVEHGRGFEIAAGATLELAPGGKHVMLMEPAAGVTAGATIAVTLRFESAADLEIVVPVRAADGS
jgi:copper(I)-binding protein